MYYVTGIHALNLSCSLETCGDWHTSGIQWENPTIRDSDKSVFKDYGIESNRKIPEHKEQYFVANHIRALLDMLAAEDFTNAQGMKEDFVCNDRYNEEIFEKVCLLKDMEHWNAIYDFMNREYGKEWREWNSGKNSTKK